MLAVVFDGQEFSLVDRPHPGIDSGEALVEIDAAVGGRVNFFSTLPRARKKTRSKVLVKF